jgi:hypothetical protein
MRLDSVAGNSYVIKTPLLFFRKTLRTMLKTVVCSIALFGILFLYRKLVFSVAEFSYWGAAGICVLVLIAGLVAAHLIDARR